MKKFIRHRTAASFCALALLALASCTADTSLRSQAESYIASNIATLSPRSATAGSTFRVTDVEWVDDDTVLVTYEDGTIILKGRADVMAADDGDVLVTNFRIENNLDTDNDDQGEDNDDQDEDGSSSSTDNEDDDSSASSSSVEMMDDSMNPSY